MGTPLQKALVDLPARQKAFMGDVYYRSAVESNIQTRLVEEAKNIAALLSERLAQKVIWLAPPSGVTTAMRARVPEPLRELKGEKTRESANRKVQGAKYDGNWDLIGDLARCTVVVERAGDIERAYLFVKEYFSNVRVDMDPLGATFSKQGMPGAFTRSGLMYHSERVFRPGSNPCGYSGYAIIVQSRGANANKGEVQINSVNMMYAKSETEFVEGFGEDRARQERTKFPLVPGFLGHRLYEGATRPPGKENTDEGKAYAAACKAYYDYFRSDPPSLHLGVKANEALAKLDPPLENVVLPPPPAIASAPSYFGESRRVWTGR
jgi:hypothetical protein